MPNPVQTLRSPIPGQWPPQGRLEGELWINFPDKRLGVIDPAGAPLDLSPIRQWSDQTVYFPRDVVMRDDGLLYRCRLPTKTGEFVLAEWSLLTKEMALPVYPEYYIDAAYTHPDADGSPAAPWPSLTEASRFLRQFDCNGRMVVVHIGEGTFNGEGFTINNGYLILIGAGVDRTIIDAQNSYLCFQIYGRGNTTVGFANMTLKSKVNYPYPYYPCVYSTNAAVVFGGYMAFDVAGGQGILEINGPARSATYSCAAEVRGDGSTIGAAAIALDNGAAVFDCTDFSFVGAPNIYTPFLRLDNRSSYVFNAPKWVGRDTFIGTKKYDIRRGSLVDSDGNGDFLPGDLPGTADPTSFYDGVQGVDPYLQYPAIYKERVIEKASEAMPPQWPTKPSSPARKP